MSYGSFQKETEIRVCLIGLNFMEIGIGIPPSNFVHLIGFIFHGIRFSCLSWKLVLVGIGSPTYCLRFFCSENKFKKLL